MSTTILPTIACPNWCTVEAEGLRHSADIVVATGEPLVAHTGAAVETPDGQFAFYIVRDDLFTDGRVQSETYIWMSAPDDPHLTLEAVMDLASAAKIVGERFSEATK